MYIIDISLTTPLKLLSLRPSNWQMAAFQFLFLLVSVLWIWHFLFVLALNPSPLRTCLIVIRGPTTLISLGNFLEMPPQTPPHSFLIRMYILIPRWFVCILKFEKHSSKILIFILTATGLVQVYIILAPRPATCEYFHWLPWAFLLHFLTLLW